MNHPPKHLLQKAFDLRHEDSARLALSLKNVSPEVRTWLVQQVKGRQRASKKLPTWSENPDIIFPPAVNLEQSSSEETALYKAERVDVHDHDYDHPHQASHPPQRPLKPHQLAFPSPPPNNNLTLVDLTGGFGVDTCYFATRARHVIHVEPNAELQSIAAHNSRVLGLSNITFLTMTAEQFLHQPEQAGTPPYDWIYIDPSRRPKASRQPNAHSRSNAYSHSNTSSQPNRAITFLESEPNVLELLDRMRHVSRRILIKASPMISIPEALNQLRKGNRAGGGAEVKEVEAPENKASEIETREIETPKVTVRDVHVVSVRNECREVLFRVDGISVAPDGMARTSGVLNTQESQNIDGIRRIAVNIHGFRNDRDDGIHSLTTIFAYDQYEEEDASVQIADPEAVWAAGKSSSNLPSAYRWIYEPNASIMKCGAFRLVGERFGLHKIAPNTHLYLSVERVDGFPGQTLEIQQVLPYRKDAVRTHLSPLKGQIATRNFPDTEPQIRKKTGIKQGDAHRILACCLSDGHPALIVGKFHPADPEPVDPEPVDPDQVAG